MGDSYGRQRSGKINAILLPIITTLLCLISIVGATLALFTNDPEDGMIGINVTMGQVQVDIVDAEQNSLVGDMLDFVAEGNEKLYFEPGSTYYTQGFQLKNTGTIPVNYRMRVSEDESVDKAKFEESFEFYVTTDLANPETAEKLTSFTGRLEAEQNSAVYYLVVKMKETADNEFQERIYAGIGVTVYAAQGNVGRNGFGRF